MLGPFLLFGLLVAVFVGFNVGGSNTGVAFGPAVGSDVVSKFGAALLTTLFFFLGGWTVGRNVVETMGGKIVPAVLFTPATSIAVLFFIGSALLVSNLFGVPASTSMTGVGAIAGLGLATGRLDWAVMGRIVSWWLVSPVLAFWVSGVVGRYFYPRLSRWFAITQSEGSLLAFDRSGVVPRPALGPNTTRREFVGTVLVIAIACYTAFSAGASNTANAIAPLVGSEAITMDQGILLTGAAVGVGALTIARRTLDTMGNDLTEMPLLAALIVAVVSSTIVTLLSALGVPVSVVIVATMSIVGLGWGRATRTVTLSATIHGESPDVSVGALAADADEALTIGGDGGTPDGADVPPIGEDDVPADADLFEPATTARVILLQNVVPAVATLAAFLVFRFTPLA